MSMKTLVVAGALSALLGSAFAQQVGTLQAEVHPPLTVATCTRAGGCTNRQQSVVLDSNWRWVHNVGGSTNCYTGNQWNTQYCPDGVSCARNCALEGANYASTYGVTSSGSALTLKYVTGSNTGSRLYLLDSTDTKYESLKLLNKEFSFDVDLSTLPCGVNGALYLSEMPQDGGVSATNVAGAKYGTGYCDAQCAQDIKFINGVGNVQGWTPVDANSGTGSTGACCAEMDIWEANKISTAYTPHPCKNPGLYACKTPTECGSGAGNRYLGACDKDGCDFNPYRQGNRTYYGPGLNVDTTRPFTVVTQFLTTDGTDAGDLSEIRRFYVQGGRVIPQPPTTFPALNNANSITDSYCTAQKTLFEDTNEFGNQGGMRAMGEAMRRGMTLVLSIWDDVTVNMLWLDAVAFPTNGDPNKPGIARGTCAITTGEPLATRAANPNAYVTYSNIKWGDIGSTNNADPYCSTSPTRQCSGSSTTTTRTTTTTTTTRPASSTTTTTTTRPASSTTTTTTTRPASSTTTTTTTRSTTTTTTTRSTTTTTTTRTTTTAASPSPSPQSNCSTRWSQCGGIGWTGATCCVAGTTCTQLNPYYFQCL